MNDHLERQQIVDIARSWLRTPYHHAARIKGVGVDCGTFLAEVFAEAGAVPTVDIADYPHDWHLHRSDEKYLAYVKRYAWEVVDGSDPDVGDVVVWKFGRCFSHGGIYIGGGLIIHSLLNIGVTTDELDGEQFNGRERKVFSIFPGGA